MKSQEIVQDCPGVLHFGREFLAQNRVERMTERDADHGPVVGLTLVRYMAFAKFFVKHLLFQGLQV
jgi:hypothetical protein